MATGDNILTAISVAKQCGILSQTNKVFYADMKGDKIVWNFIGGEANENGDDIEIKAAAFSRKAHPESDEDMVKGVVEWDI